MVRALLFPVCLEPELTIGVRKPVQEMAVLEAEIKLDKALFLQFVARF